MTSPRLRIGELSKRVGVSPELLRAWEARYGLVQPERTPGGLRLYSGADERRVRAMCENLAAGMSAAEAARVALSGAGEGDREARPADLEAARQELRRALDAMNEPRAQIALDTLFATADTVTVLSGAVLPLLRDVGDRWAAGEATVADEHFASNVIGGRLRALARGWGDGVGPQAVLACPPGEQHDLGLLCFGLMLRARGWRIAYLGAATPPADIAAALDKARPAVVVLAASAPRRFRDAAEGLRELASGTRVAIGGSGATPSVADALGAELLAADAADAALALQP